MNQETKKSLVNVFILIPRLHISKGIETLTFTPGS